MLEVATAMTISEIIDATEIIKGWFLIFLLVPAQILAGFRSRRMTTRSPQYVLMLLADGHARKVVSFSVTVESVEV